MVLNINVSSAVVTAIRCELRTVDGKYLGGSSNIDLSSYITATGLSKAQGLLIVTLENSSGWGITNNTPFAGKCTISYTVS